MAQAQGNFQQQVDVLDLLVDYRLDTVYTSIPCRVTQVNYTETHLNAQPLIRHKNSDETQDSFPEILEVPFFVYSSNGGSTAIVIPPQVGDTVIVHFSMRDPTNFHRSDGAVEVDTPTSVALGMYPLYATPSIYPQGRRKPIHSSNIVIENGSTTIEVSRNGSISVRTTEDVNVNASDVNYTCENFNLNGTFNHQGNFSSNGGIFEHNGTNVGSTHTHGGVQGGSTNTAVPNP